jgi:signal transduction histidine kinase/CheY-like chemotaxis protein
MFKRFSQQLAVRLSTSVVVIEIIFMTLVGIIYFNRFAAQIDARQVERLQMAAEMINQNRLNLTSLADRNTMSLLIGEEIEDAMLITSKGKVAYSLNPKYRRNAVADVPFLDKNDLDFDTPRPILKRVEIEGQRYLVSFNASAGWQTPVEGTDQLKLILYFRTNVASAEREKFNVIILLLVGFAITAIATSATLTLVLNRMVLARVVRLASTARKVEAGDLTVRADLEETSHQTEDEIAVLQRGFNAMVDRLQVFIAMLEERVAERTHALGESNQQLQLARDAAEDARRNAEAANKAKSAFLANMSHELRTPLNAVLGFAQLLKVAPDATGQQVESLNIITRSGEHLLNLINNILDISKIESGHVLPEESDTDLHQLIQEMRSLMYVKAKEKSLEFSLVQSPDLPRHVLVDAGKLRQVLINLLGNAIKFTQAGGVILQAGVAAWMPGQSARVRFEVKDSGPGIQAQDLGWIFKPFEQLTNQHVTEPGTGLGLTICKQYVDLMNGQLDVSSESGKGSVFYFEIPVALLPDEEVPAESPRGRVIGIEEGLQDLRLLIVEDQPENRLLLFKLLEPLGFELRQASNGQEAVELFEQWHPHLIWMDIRMPVMDGREATRRIKQTEAGANTKIIALTAHALEDERREILASGCDDFLRKPYRDSEIFAALSKHLGIRFRYADEVHPGMAQKVCAVSVDQFDVFPQEIADELLKAVELLDSPRTLEVIHRIGNIDQDLAMRLRDMVKNLQYKELLRMLDKLAKRREGE